MINFRTYHKNSESERVKIREPFKISLKIQFLEMFLFSEIGGGGGGR